MTTILFHARTVKHSPSFGAGLSAEHRPGFADELVRAIGAPVPIRRWATDDEYEAHRLATTLSADEYAALKAEAEAAALDRYARADQAEANELGIPAEAMDRLAEEARQMDALCGHDFGPVAEVRRVEIKGTRYTAETIPAGEDNASAVRLTKADGTVYDVARTLDGRVVCDCPHYEFTMVGTADRCKHGAALDAAGLLPEAGKPRRPRPVTMHHRSLERTKARRLAMA
jgi:hypothetical protein